MMLMVPLPMDVMLLSASPALETMGCGTDHNILDVQFPEVLTGDDKAYEIHRRCTNISKCKSIPS